MKKTKIRYRVVFKDYYDEWSFDYDNKESAIRCLHRELKTDSESGSKQTGYVYKYTMKPIYKARSY